MDGGLGQLEPVTLSRANSKKLKTLNQLSLIQLVTTTAFNWAIWVYAIVQYAQAANWITSPTSSLIDIATNIHPTRAAEIALIAIGFLFCVGWLFLTWKLYFVFGWTTYKEMGADVNVRNVLYLYHIYVLLLKVDVFFFLGFDIQFLALVLKNFDTTFIVHVFISIPGTIGALVIGYYAIRKENKSMVYTTLVLCVILIGYLISKLVDVNSSDTRFSSSKNSLTFFIFLTLVLILLTMGAAVANMRHFGEGLMSRLSTSFDPSDTTENFAFEVRQPIQ